MPVHEPEVVDAWDRGFGPGPRFFVHGAKIGGRNLAEGDVGMLADLIAAMPARPSSLTCARYQGKPILIAFLDMGTDEVAEQIVETVRRLMTERYAVHVRWLTIVGQARSREDAIPSSWAIIP